MYFIFPKNYNFKSKLLGFIDYSTAIFDIIIGIIFYFIINIFFTNIDIKIYVFISFYFPILLFSIIGINKESVLSIFVYMFAFFKNQNIYLFKK